MPKQPPQPKLLIFVIAYYAEETLVRVLERIPAVIFQRFDCEVLVVDDASEDRTFAIGRQYKEKHPEIRMTVLRNELNQGYGGNQKVGYAYAVAGNFDFVAMVHGDGQYAPEELPRLLEPLVRGEADAVFGSRMMTRFGALKGGMPLYKYVGNKILTTAQNALLGSSLSEFHSGYRIYAVPALRRIPFRLNANDFHFDTEIILQLLNAGLRIRELPIPTFYGDEISRVNGMKYAKDIMLATVRNVAHRAGILYQRRFDTAPTDEMRHALKLGYPSSHSWALETVPEGAKVLEIGLGHSALSSELVAKGCDAAAVVPVEPAEKTAKVKVHVQDLNSPPEFDSKPYKYLLLLDVIEHLENPEQFVERLRAQFEHEPKTLVLTTPNVAFGVQRLMLLLGQFNYGKAGILDKTHRRLFTFRSIRRLLLDCGFRIKEIRGVPAPFPKALGDGPLGRAALAANLAAIRLSKTLFSYQIFIVAESTPDVDFVLRDAREKSAERAAKLRPETEPPQLDGGPKRARSRKKSGAA